MITITREPLILLSCDFELLNFNLKSCCYIILFSPLQVNLVIKEDY